LLINFLIKNFSLTFKKFNKTFAFSQQPTIKTTELLWDRSIIAWSLKLKLDMFIFQRNSGNQLKADLFQKQQRMEKQLAIAQLNVQVVFVACIQKSTKNMIEDTTYYQDCFSRSNNYYYFLFFISFCYNFNWIIFNPSIFILHYWFFW